MEYNLITVFFAFAVIFPVALASNSVVACEAIDHDQIDLIFVVDGTAKTTSMRFISMLEFVHSISENLVIGPGKTYVGMTSYGDEILDDLPLDPTMERNTLLEDIRLVSYVNGTKDNAGAAIRFAAEEFSKAKRSGPKVIVFIADSPSLDDLQGPADAARLKGIELMAIGTSNNANDQNQMNKIANFENSRIFLHVDLNDHKTLAATLARRIKQVANQWCFTAIQAATVTLVSNQPTNTLPSNTMITLTCSMTPTHKDITYQWLKDSKVLSSIVWAVKTQNGVSNLEVQLSNNNEGIYSCEAMHPLYVNHTSNEISLKISAANTNNNALSKSTVNSFNSKTAPCNAIDYDQMDVFFVIDGTTRTTDAQFHNMVVLVRHISENLPTGPGKTNVAVAQYGDDILADVSLDPKTTRAAVIDQIGFLKWVQGVKDNAGKAIQFAAEQLSKANRASPKVIVFIADSPSYDDLQGPADVARLNNIELIAIALSHSANDQNQLSSVTDYDPGRIFIQSDMNAIPTLAWNLAKRIKQSANERCFTEVNALANITLLIDKPSNILPLKTMIILTCLMTPSHDDITYQWFKDGMVLPAGIWAVMNVNGVSRIKMQLNSFTEGKYSCSAGHPLDVNRTSNEIALKVANLSYSGIYKNAAVAADNGLCSDIGKEVLKKGGNAVDAAIATAICIGVVDPHSSGLGGGHFLTIYNKRKKSCIILDARETAPRALDERVYEKDPSLATVGWLGVAVPGEVHGFWTAYKNFGSGKIPWADLWQPTITLCYTGVPVSEALAKLMQNEKRWLMQSPYFNDYMNPVTGEPKAEGDIVLLRRLASTMEGIAFSKDPVQFFYNGSVARLMAREFANNGGIITQEDMQNYTVKFGPLERPAVYTKLPNEGLTFCAPPPPSSGSLTAAVINILDAFNMSKPINKSNSTATGLLFHRFVETLKFIYGMRDKLGDMDFIDSALRTAQMANFPAYSQFISEAIGQSKSVSSPIFYGASSCVKSDHGTSQISVIDQDGNAVSMTSSINTYFGSQVRSAVTGIIYNNQMDDFSIRTASNFYGIAPSEQNRMAPGKRPQSSISPLIAFDEKTGEVKMVVGAEGGVKIIAAVSQVIMRVLYLKETIDEAIQAPRIYNQLLPYATTYEAGFPKDILNELQTKYDQLLDPNVNPFFSVVTGINRLPDGRLEASSDHRKAGGYTAGL